MEEEKDVFMLPVSKKKGCFVGGLNLNWGKT